MEGRGPRTALEKKDCAPFVTGMLEKEGWRVPSSRPFLLIDREATDIFTASPAHV